MDVPPRRTGVDYFHNGSLDDSSATASISFLVEQLTGFVRRQFQVFIIVPIGAIVLGLLYLLVTPPQYSATASLLIDSHKLSVLQNLLQPAGEMPLDTAQVESQVEILRSDSIGLAVIRELNLTENPEFATPSGDVAKPDKERQALDVFLRNSKVSRVGRTYVLDAKYQTTRRASAWLQDRINELKAQATSADRAVLEFKEKNNIVDVGGSSGATGAGASSRLIGEQQLLELNSQLVTARVATGEAKARLERIEQVRKLDISEGAVTDTLRNEVITRLRNQYLDLAAREATLSNRYGRDHLAANNLREQMEELRRSIGEELGRIAASYKSDHEIAKAREENLERTLSYLVSAGQLTNRDRLGLMELESTAKVYRSLYDNFLQRQMEAAQQQSFPITDTRVITPAAPPSKKSKPVSSLVLTIAATMGLILSIGIATLREAIDGVFRTARQAEEALGIRCLAVIPLAARQAPRAPETDYLAAARAPSYADVWRRPKDQGKDGAEPDTARFLLSDPLMRRVVDEPLSAFTEAFRSIKMSAELRAATQDSKVIGITSTLPSEGKSVVACNLAALMADAGKRVILVDTDLRRPTVANSLSPRPTGGLMEVLTGKLELQQAVGRDHVTGLTFLPLVLNEQLVHSDEILSSSAFKNLIEQLRRRYDYIIMDLPPIAPVVDVRATLQFVDSFVFVVEWGATKIKAAQRHLAAETELYESLLGVVLNKANLKVLGRFERHTHSHNGYYAQQ
jgi:polysaccharide biosynthesis transport protein